MSNATENGIRLVVRHCVPSLNRLFAMNPWQRRREKLATQAAFASAWSSGCGMNEQGKFAVRGSRQGLLLADVPAQKTLFVCEGPTDTVCRGPRLAG